jgi:protoporphyrinogen/coproporphyrinogen III oxidase
MHHVVIIGGGIAGLTAAYRLRTDAGDRIRYRLIEAGPRLGGKIVTERVDGFTIEGGPDSVIAQKPWALELMRELGLGDRLLPSNDDRGGTSVLCAGRLVPLPAGTQLLSPERWGEFLRSPLLPWPAKLRFAMERWVPRRDADGDADESVADFVRRRLGEGALWRLAEPVLAHVHAADVERMSLTATYPRLAELEKRYGSLHRGVATLRAERAARTANEPLFWTLKDGLAELVDALVARLDSAMLLTGRRATRLRRAESGWTVGLNDGGEIDAGAVILATPAAVTAELVAEHDDGLAARLSAFRCASMATLSLGFREADVRGAARGFGFFVPRRALPAGVVLAGSWTSTKFDHRAPTGHALLRVFLGGAGGEATLELDDDALTRAVRDDLRAILGLTAEPVTTRLSRWPAGYPQYDVGHLERVRELEAALPPGLFVAGSPYHGVGLPDCVQSGTDAARRAAEGH